MHFNIIGNSGYPSKCQGKPHLPITPNYLSNPALAPKVEKRKGRFSEEWHSNSIPENDSKRKLEEGKSYHQKAYLGHFFQTAIVKQYCWMFKPMNVECSINVINIIFLKKI